LLPINNYNTVCFFKHERIIKNKLSTALSNFFFRLLFLRKSILKNCYWLALRERERILFCFYSSFFFSNFVLQQKCFLCSAFVEEGQEEKKIEKCSSKHRSFGVDIYDSIYRWIFKKYAFCHQ